MDPPRGGVKADLSTGGAPCRPHNPLAAHAAPTARPTVRPVRRVVPAVGSEPHATWRVHARHVVSASGVNVNDKPMILVLCTGNSARTQMRQWIPETDKGKS